METGIKMSDLVRNMQEAIKYGDFEVVTVVPNGSQVKVIPVLGFTSCTNRQTGRDVCMILDATNHDALRERMDEQAKETGKAVPELGDLNKAVQ